MLSAWTEEGRVRGWIAGSIAAALIASPVLADKSLSDRVDPRPSDEFSERMREIVEWIGANSDYPGELTKPVAVAFVPRPVLNYIFFETAANASYSGQDSVKGLYLERGIMLLPDDFKLGEHDYILVHELVHHLQWEHDRGFPCLAKREREAYELQARWVEESGVGVKPNPLFMLMLRCNLGS
jgi:hypothetical protein